MPFAAFSLGVTDMALRLPPLPLLRLFEAAGRHQSFKQAAAELGVTPSAVSHGVVTLEHWLGIDLFERGHRGLKLSAAGGDYLRYVSEALSMIANGTQRLSTSRSERRIALSCAPTFAARWLMPRLGRFRARHPDIALTIDTAHRQVGFPGDGVDLAIRMGPGPWPGLKSTRLIVESLVPVGAPNYVKTLQTPSGQIDFSRANLLHLSSVAEDWATWLQAAGIAPPDLSKGLHFDTLHLALDAAAAGLGIAVGRKPLVDTELANGTLVPAGAPVVASSTAYWLIASPAVAGRPEIAAFKRWLVGEIAAVSRLG